MENQFSHKGTKITGGTCKIWTQIDADKKIDKDK